jgi:hypothetical protein
MKKIVCLLLICLIGMTSCRKDVLDKKPLEIISDNDLWNDPALIDAYLTSAYTGMSILTNEVPDNSYFGGVMWFNINSITEVSDEAMGNWIKNSHYAYKFKLDITGSLPGFSPLLPWWDESYKIIRSLNEFIVRVPTAPVEESFKKQRIAEARFLRAYNYFAMVKRYGGVPLITVPQQPNDRKEELFPKRAKEQAIYDFVLSEIDAIANELPETQGPEYGRPTKFAALALKSRAALYAGSIAQFGTVQLNGITGIEASQANMYYQKSYDASQLIINSGKYSLYKKFPADKVKNFRQLFLEKNNPEVIFARIHDDIDGGKNGQGWGYDFFNTPVPNAWGAGSQLAPYLEMAEEFEYIDGKLGKLDRTAIQQGLWTPEELWRNKDPRFFASIFTYNTPWKGTLLDFHNGLIKPDGTIITTGSYNNVPANGTQSANARLDYGTGFGVLKYLNEAKDNMGERATSNTDWIVFRYGEILLNYAEAANELGKTGDALNAINQVRERGGIALLASVDRDKIRHERKVELAFEGHRYWDVRRWRTAVVDLSKNNSGLRYILDFSTGKLKLKVNENIDGTVAPPTFLPKNYYLPITLSRSAQNSNLVENWGY